MKIIIRICLTTALLLNFNSCCENEARIIDITFSGAYWNDMTKEDEDKYYLAVNEVNNRLAFVVSKELEILSSVPLFGNVCYATTCGITELNNLLPETFELACNRSIIIQGDTIQPLTNWWTNNKVRDGINFFENLNNDLVFEFTDDFHQQAVIPNGDYIFYFTARTDDNQFYADTTDLRINF